MTFHKALPLFAVTLGLLAACDRPMDDPYLFDGPKPAGYDTDLAQCKSIAATYKADDITGAAIGGAAIGGVLGAVDDSNDNELEGALGGAAAGALVGSLSAQEKVGEARRDVVIRCLQGRGYRVIG